MFLVKVELLLIVFYGISQLHMLKMLVLVCSVSPHRICRYRQSISRIAKVDVFHFLHFT